jgi:hypothetical protein
MTEITPESGGLEIQGHKPDVSWTYLKRNWLLLVPLIVLTLGPPFFRLCSRGLARGICQSCDCRYQLGSRSPCS